MMDSHCRAGVTVGIQGGGSGRPQPLGRAGAAGGGRICREVRLQDSEPGGRELASVPPRVRLAPPRNLGGRAGTLAPWFRGGAPRRLRRRWQQAAAPAATVL